MTKYLSYKNQYGAELAQIINANFQALRGDSCAWNGGSEKQKD